MPVLRVAVKHKIATYISRAGEIVCGNSDYSIQFDFDEEWEAFDKKIARFIWNGAYFDQEFEGDRCPVPIISDADSLQVGLYTYGDLHTTTSAVIPCCLSILDMVDTPHTENDEKYVSEAQAAAVEAKEAAEDAKNCLSGLDTRMTEVEDQIAELLYTQNPLTITKFENNVKNKYIGQTVTEVTFSWSFSKVPTSVKLCDSAGNTIKEPSVNSTGTTVPKLSVKNTTKWKLKVTDERNKETQSETTITFLHGVYFGVGAPRDSYDRDFVLGLSGVEWRITKRPSITESPNKEHIYYCLPTWMGACNFSVGVLPGGFVLADTIMLENEYGYTQNYYIYKSVELLEGTSVKVNIS